MAPRKDHAFDLKKAPVDLVPGDVIYWGKGSRELALVISNEYPAATIPVPNHLKYCEPGLVILTHLREDMWIETDEFGYALLDIQKRMKVVTSLRIQHPKHQGMFLKHTELVKAMAI